MALLISITSLELFVTQLSIAHLCLLTFLKSLLHFSWPTGYIKDEEKCVRAFFFLGYRMAYKQTNPHTHTHIHGLRTPSWLSFCHTYNKGVPFLAQKLFQRLYLASLLPLSLLLLVCVASPT